MKKIYSLLAGIIMGCGGPQTQAIDEGPYFDLKGLVNQQIIWLDSLKPELLKHAEYQNNTEQTRFRPDSTEWVRELELFKKADINKPVLKGQYNELTGASEKTSNLQVKVYEPRSPDLEVKMLKIYFIHNLNDVRKIEAQLTEVNPLYSGNQFLKMEFADDGYGNPILNSYTIEGMQKMRLMDTVIFKIRGEIL